MSKITDLKFDDKNFNKGTEYGKSLMEKSLSKFGAGRSILIDKNDKIIAGNKTAENFAELGLENIKIIESDGKTLVAVKRNDIDLDTPEGREFALADNQTAKVNIDFDFEELESELEVNVLEDWGVRNDIIEVDDEMMVVSDYDEIPKAKELDFSDKYIIVRFKNDEEYNKFVTELNIPVEISPNFKNESNAEIERKVIFDYEDLHTKFK
ncbi:hypothetical protein GO491_11720 [Flavobacteriaceae bacterium Ap0902]|nr:hypothetical protein [Flavobacteriaceae bacterium Ap0902]